MEYSPRLNVDSADWATLLGIDWMRPPARTSGARKGTTGPIPDGAMVIDTNLKKPVFKWDNASGVTEWRDASGNVVT